MRESHGGTMNFGLRDLGGDLRPEEIVGRWVRNVRFHPKLPSPQAVEHLFYQRMCQQLHSFELYFVPGGLIHNTKNQRRL